MKETIEIIVGEANEEVAFGVVKALHAAGCPCVVMTFTRAGVFGGSLRWGCDIVVIDKLFCGSALETAVAIGKIRGDCAARLFGVEFTAVGGDLVDLRQAGCDMTFSLAGLSPDAATNRIYSEIMAIVAE